MTVDATVCEANGFCESLAPEVFELGEADVATCLTYFERVAARAGSLTFAD